MKALIDHHPVYIIRTYEDGNGWGDEYTNAVGLTAHQEIVALTKPPTKAEWVALETLLKELGIHEYSIVRYKDGQRIEKKMKIK